MTSCSIKIPKTVTKQVYAGLGPIITRDAAYAGREYSTLGNLSIGRLKLLPTHSKKCNDSCLRDWIGSNKPLLIISK